MVQTLTLQTMHHTHTHTHQTEYPPDQHCLLQQCCFAKACLSHTKKALLNISKHADGHKSQEGRDYGKVQLEFMCRVCFKTFINATALKNIMIMTWRRCGSVCEPASCPHWLRMEDVSGSVCVDVMRRGPCQRFQYSTVRVMRLRR